MRLGRIREAALKFADCGIELGETFTDVLSALDVTRYGMLCGMAALSREELDTHLRSNKRFRDFADLAPAMREAMNQFYASKYAAFFEYMQKARGDFLADLYAADTFQRLFEMIRARAVLQYTIPYSKLHLGKMAAVFSMSQHEVVVKLAELITNGQIAARIDLGQGVLVKTEEDKRAANFELAERVGEQLYDNLVLMMRRLELERNKIVVQQPGGLGRIRSIDGVPDVAQ
jgi:COP9 signalosome complex subunit 1